MPWMPDDSAIKVDATLEEKIQNASAEEIKSLLHSALVDQGICTRDYYDSSVLLEVAPGTAPRSFARSVTIDGTKHIVTSPTELELEKAVGDLYRSQLQPAKPAQKTEQPRDAQGKFVEQGRHDETAAVNAEQLAALEMQWKLGNITTADYLEKSGAVDAYLTKVGIPVGDLKEAAIEKQNQRTKESWAQATESFKQRHSDWPGGEANLKLVGDLIIANNLVDSDPLEALEAAYNHAKENDLLVPNPEVELYERIAAANSPSELSAALQPPARRQHRMEVEHAGMFNR